MFSFSGSGHQINRKGIVTYPLCIRFTLDRKSFYYPIGGSYTKREFSEICESQKSKSSRYEVKKDCLDTIQKYKTLLESLNKGQELTLEMVRTAITHDSQDEELSFIGIWENTIERLRNENGGARYTTAEFYDNALKSFRKILWNEHIDGFHIGLEHIRKWNEGMKNGVADETERL